MSFDTLNLHSKILKAVTDSGYLEATKIQLNAIPKILSGLDVRASAQTGTGKTAAFLLPALNKLTVDSPIQGNGPRVLILVPTRELATQIAEQSEKYSQFLGRVRTVCVVGGVPYHEQMKKMARPYDILIATPGRLIDYIQQKKIDFSRVEMLILDEADRMLDMGFTKPVEDIINATPRNRQMLLFSATMQKGVIQLSERLMNNPVEIMIHKEHESHDNISQTFHFVDNLSHKNRLLEHILGGDDVKYAIIFTSTKRHANELVMELKAGGHRAGALHGDMNQRQRFRTLTQLKAGKINVLVATDVAARGIDVETITHVINFDLPNNPEDYVHRIGRTGRAGAKGFALSFANHRDASLVREIGKFTGQEVKMVEIEGFESTAPKHSKGFTAARGRGSPRGGSPRGRSNAAGSSRGRFGGGNSASRGRFGNSDAPRGRFGRSSAPSDRSSGSEAPRSRFGRSSASSDRSNGSEVSRGRFADTNASGGFPRKSANKRFGSGSGFKKEGSASSQGRKPSRDGARFKTSRFS